MPPARPEPLEIGTRRFEWGRRTYVMGILNVTPDSFSGDGLTDPGEAVRRALRMREEGADIIDVGGESTRPGWTPVDADEELRRVLPVIDRLREAAPGLPISIDTAKPRVAAAAFAAGASLLNDVNGLRGDPDLARVAAEHGVPVVAMHNQRGREPSGDPVDALHQGILASLAAADDAGIPRERIILDPGFGFGWEERESYEILRRLAELRHWRRPLLAGLSRKRVAGEARALPPGDRVEGTIALCVLAIAGGADLIRVHDVLPLARTARIADDALRPSRGGDCADA